MASPPPPQQFLTIADIAAELAIDAQTVRELIDSGELLAINAGAGSKRPTLRIDPASYAQFIERRRVRTA